MIWKVVILLVILVGLVASGIFIFDQEVVEDYLALGAERLEGFLSSASFDPSDTREIGYEFLDDGKVVHLWNTHPMSYFFNISSGIQFTNHHEDYWTTNVFCIGYYAAGEWNKIHCADEFSDFNRNIHTDNSTYANATLWRDFTYSGYDFRFGVQYHLGLEDENLSITLYGENRDTEDIPFDIGFAWRVKEVNIPGLEEDYITINNTEYPLNGNYDITFNNLDEPNYIIHDLTKYLRLDWDKDLTDAVKIFGDGNQENFTTTLLINAGQFISGQNKSTTLYWIDADTKVDDTPYSLLFTDLICGPYWINTTQAIVVFQDQLKDARFVYTQDAGVSWTDGGTFYTGTIERMSCWFDQENPSNDGTLIHINWLDSGTGTDYYRTLDAVDFSLGTQRTVIDGLTVSGEEVLVRTTLTQTNGGNLLVAISTQAEIEMLRSVDGGINWVDRADVFEGGTEEDWAMLFPANTADDNDASAFFWDRNANTVSLKMYDDSENTWTETELATGMTESTQMLNFDGSIRHSDGHLIISVHSNDEHATDDLRVWDLSIEDIATPTVTEKANVFTDQPESTDVAVLINQQNEDIYIAYLNGTLFGASDLTFHLSEDGGTTWDVGTRYSETTDDNRISSGGRTVGDNGGRVQWVFFEDDLNDLWVNLNNDIEIPASGVADNFPTVTLSKPSDDTSNETTFFNFQCNVTDDFNIENTTLWIWNSTGVFNNTEVNVSTGTSQNYTFPVVNFIVDEYEWNCLAFDNASQSAWATANFSLNVTAADTCSPTSPLSANYQYECADNCTISANVDAAGFNVTINGTGVFLLNANITGFDVLKLIGESSTRRCTARCVGSGCFRN